MAPERVTIRKEYSVKDLTPFVLDKLLSTASQFGFVLHQLDFDVESGHEKEDGTKELTVKPVQIRKAKNIKTPAEEGSSYYLLKGGQDHDYLVELDQRDIAFESLAKELQLFLGVTQVPRIENMKNKRGWQEQVLKGKVGISKSKSVFPGIVIKFPEELGAGKNSFEVNEYDAHNDTFLNNFLFSLEETQGLVKIATT